MIHYRRLDESYSLSKRRELLTRRHITDDLNVRQNRCENLKYRQDFCFLYGEVPGSNLGCKIGCPKFPQLVHRLISFTHVIPQFDVINPALITASSNEGKVCLRTGHVGPGKEQRYSFTLPLTSELDGVDGQRHAPVALPPEKTRYPFYKGDRGSTVVKVLFYKSEGRWFDSRWCHWNFSLT